MDGTRLMVKKELFTFECEEFIETEISGHLMERNAILVSILLPTNRRSTLGGFS
jgi:hypothetical protein